MFFVDSPRFLGVQGIYRAKRRWEADEVGTTHLGMPGPPGPPWWVVPPSGHPQVLLLPNGCFLVHKTSTKSFVVFRLRLILISCDVMNKQETTTGTGHWVNRLVPKNDIKLL